MKEVFSEEIRSICESMYSNALHRSNNRDFSHRAIAPISDSPSDIRTMGTNEN